MGLFSFILGKSNLRGTNTERRIDQVVEMGLKASQVYQLKDTTGLLNAHAHKYHPELIQYVQRELTPLMYYFGYANVDDNPFGIFKYNQHTKENLRNYMQYRRDNEIELERVCADDFKEKSKLFISYSTPRSKPMVDEYQLLNNQTPVIDRARKAFEKAQK